MMLEQFCSVCEKLPSFLILIFKPKNFFHILDWLYSLGTLCRCFLLWLFQTVLGRRWNNALYQWRKLVLNSSFIYLWTHSFLANFWSNLGLHFFLSSRFCEGLVLFSKLQMSIMCFQNTVCHEYFAMQTYD